MIIIQCGKWNSRIPVTGIMDAPGTVRAGSGRIKDGLLEEVMPRM